MPTLDGPTDADQLYLARGDEVSPHRPLFTGDVLSELEIPGVEETGPAMLLDHPCSMRRGHKLRPRVVAARILPRADLIADGAWPTSGFYDWFPLPGLSPEHTGLAVRLDLVGRVRSGGLVEVPRLACMSLDGIALLWQRKVHRDTRFVAPTNRLLDLIEPAFFEVEIWEEWAEAFEPGRLADGDSPGLAIEHVGKDFADFLDGHDLRAALEDKGRRPSVRRAVRAEIRARSS